MKTTALLASFLVISITLLGGVSLSAVPVTAAETSTIGGCTIVAPFIVTDVSWGAPSSPQGVGPGSRDAPLTVSLLFNGPCSATAASFELSLSQPFSGTNGASNLTNYEVNLAPFSITPETYYVNIALNASLGTYTFPLYIGYNTSSFSGLFYQTVEASIALNGVPSISFASRSPYLYAGEVNFLTILTSNDGTGVATSIVPSVSSPSQVSVLNSLSPISQLSPGSNDSQTLQVFVPSSMAGSASSLTIAATYYDSYSVARTTMQSLGFYVTSSAPFVAQTAEWGSADPSPQPGDNAVPMVISLQYSGSTTLTSLEVTLSLPSGFTSQDGGSASTTSVGEVSPGQSLQLTFYTNIATSVAAGSYPFALNLNFSSAFVSGQRESITITPPAIGQRPSISVTQLNDTVTDGVPSSLVFQLKNTGFETIFSPAFSLTVSSPLIVLDTSPSSDSSLAPGQVEAFTAVLSASPTATPGVYSGSLSVTFVDQSGTQNTLSFPAGFVLVGTIVFVIQDEQIVQSSTGLTVSGSLLNEGGASAYYAQVTGSVRGFPGSNATAYYAGEIDPNSPVSFTIMIPLSAPSRAQNAAVLLDIEYKDSFGSIHTVATSSTTSLQSDQQLAASQVTTTTQASSGGDLVSFVTLAVIAAIVIVGVAGAVMVRRRRAAMNPAKKQQEQKII